MSTSDVKPTDHSLSAGQLRLNRITPLKAPGPDSNYLDWSFVAELYFQAVNLSHVLTHIEPHLCTSSWPGENATVCSTLSQIVEDSNLRDLRDGRNDAAKMWSNLKRSHQDSSSGGRMYWLRKLLLQRLSGNDVEAHINDMQAIHDQLASLITPENL